MSTVRISIFVFFYVIVLILAMILNTVILIVRREQTLVNNTKQISELSILRISDSFLNYLNTVEKSNQRIKSQFDSLNAYGSEIPANATANAYNRSLSLLKVSDNAPYTFFQGNIWLRPLRPDEMDGYNASNAVEEEESNGGNNSDCYTDEIGACTNTPRMVAEGIGQYRTNSTAFIYRNFTTTRLADGVESPPVNEVPAGTFWLHPELMEMLTFSASDVGLWSPMIRMYTNRSTNFQCNGQAIVYAMIYYQCAEFFPKGVKPSIVNKQSEEYILQENLMSINDTELFPADTAKDRFYCKNIIVSSAELVYLDQLNSFAISPDTAISFYSYYFMDLIVYPRCPSLSLFSGQIYDFFHDNLAMFSEAVNATISKKETYVEKNVTTIYAAKLSSGAAFGFASVTPRNFFFSSADQDRTVSIIIICVFAVFAIIISFYIWWRVARPIQHICELMRGVIRKKEDRLDELSDMDDLDILAENDSGDTPTGTSDTEKLKAKEKGSKQKKNKKDRKKDRESKKVRPPPARGSAVKSGKCCKLDVKEVIDLRDAYEELYSAITDLKAFLPQEMDFNNNNMSSNNLELSQLQIAEEPFAMYADPVGISREFSHRASDPNEEADVELLPIIFPTPLDENDVLITSPGDKLYGKQTSISQEQFQSSCGGNGLNTRPSNSQIPSKDDSSHNGDFPLSIEILHVAGESTASNSDEAAINSGHTINGSSSYPNHISASNSKLMINSCKTDNPATSAASLNVGGRQWGSISTNNPLVSDVSLNPSWNYASHLRRQAKLRSGIELVRGTGLLFWLNCPVVNTQYMQDAVTHFMHVIVEQCIASGVALSQLRPDYISILFTGRNHSAAAVRFAEKTMQLFSPAIRSFVRAVLDAGQVYIVDCGGPGKIYFGDPWKYLMTLIHFHQIGEGRILLTDRVASMCGYGDRLLPTDNVIPLSGESSVLLFVLLDTVKVTPELAIAVQRHRRAFFEGVKGSYEQALKTLQGKPNIPNADEALNQHLERALRYLIKTKPRRPNLCRFQLPSFETLGSERHVRRPVKLYKQLDTLQLNMPLPQIEFFPSMDATLRNTGTVNTAPSRTLRSSGFDAVAGASNSGASEIEELGTTLKDSSGQLWYRLPQMIGSGSFADVYRAVSATGALAAIKCIRLNQVNVNVEDVVQEVNTSCKLYNEYIVNYTSWTQQGPHLVLFMEYMPGGTLGQIIDAFPDGVAPSVAARYAMHILRGLAYLHKNNIVHADLKPDNVLLTSDGHCKVSDFGSSVTKANALLASGDVFSLRGTPVYMAPEVAAGDPPTSASDMWSLGITMFEMLTGLRPWVWAESGEPVFPRASLLPSDTAAADAPPQISSNSFLQDVIRGKIVARVLPQEGIDTPYNQLLRTLPDKYPGLVEIVSGCLDKNQEKRGTAENFLRTLAIPE